VFSGLLDEIVQRERRGISEEESAIWGAPIFMDSLDGMRTFEEIRKIFFSSTFHGFLVAEQKLYKRCSRESSSEPPLSSDPLSFWNAWLADVIDRAATGYLSSGSEEIIRLHVFASLVRTRIHDVLKDSEEELLKFLALERFLLESCMVLNRNFQRTLSALLAEMFAWVDDDTADSEFYATDDNPSSLLQKDSGGISFSVEQGEDSITVYGCEIEGRRISLLSFVSVNFSPMGTPEKFELFFLRLSFSEKMRMVAALYDEDLLNAFPRIRTLLAFGRLPDADKDIS